MRVGVLCLDPITQKCTRSIIFLLASILNIETITGFYSAQFLVKRYRNCEIPWWRCLTQEENRIRQTQPRFYTNAIIIEVSLCSFLFQNMQPRVDGRVRVRGLEIIPGVARQMRFICTKTATSSQVGKTLYLKKLYFLTAKANIARFYLTR